MKNVQHELNCLLRLERRYGLGLYPFGELVDRDQEVIVALGHFLKRPQHVKPPNHEGPCDGNCL